MAGPAARALRLHRGERDDGGMGLRRRFAAFRARLREAPRPDAAPEEPEEAPAGEPVRPRLVVGLGNPGGEYRGTRHNAGASCIERLAARHGAKLERDRRVLRATIEIEGHTLHLATPRSYYNESGPAVASELRRLRLLRDALLVVYDEIDLPLARVRMRPQGGHGGNNGMRSIIGSLGGGDFPRIRIGIDRPYDDGKPVRDPDRVADWVLGKPGREEREALEAAVEAAADAVEVAVRESVEAAMRSLHDAGGGE